MVKVGGQEQLPKGPAGPRDALSAALGRIGQIDHALQTPTGGLNVAEAHLRLGEGCQGPGVVAEAVVG
jgi:hypothetical protein